MGRDAASIAAPTPRVAANVINACIPSATPGLRACEADDAVVTSTVTTDDVSDVELSELAAL
jgi:hypothetical protein